jgi:hypothetical protein
MQLVARPVVIGGSALIASSLFAVAPVSSPADLHRVSGADVRLVDAESSLLSDLGLGSLSGLLSDVGSSSSGLLDQSSVLWIPYNIFADIVNIPYTESLALQEYAYALGPAGSTGGVAGWIPPGATVTDGGVEVINGQDYYASGGTGSWWMESIGNTWGWDNGNWPQVDALLHFVLPLQWTEGLAESVQSVAQSAFIDGAQNANCEFQCSDVVGYLGGWLTHLGNVFNSTYPTTTTDTIGENGAASPTFPDGVVNVGPFGTETTAIWSGQPVPFNPLLEPFEAIWQNAIEGPANNPIMFPDIGNVFDSAVKLAQDLVNDFDPLIQGSFVYWGADTLYSIPSLIGGLVHDVSLGLIPNEFVLPDNGAEPITGYTTNISDVLPGLAQGFQFLLNGLEGYFNPATYGASATDATLGSLSDSTALSSELSTVLSSAGTDFASLMGPGLGTDVSSLLSELAASLTP